MSLLCHIYVSVSWANIGSGNGLAPIQHQAIIWTDTDLLSIGPLQTNFSEILIEIYTFHSIQENAFGKVICLGGDEFNNR